MLDDFNAENRRLGTPLLEEKKDMIPKAYTHKEHESLKVFSDTAYGFYDHGRSSLFKHMAWGTVFAQFLTYWPSKVKYYFGKETESSYGQYEQKYTLDEDGNKQML